MAITANGTHLIFNDSSTQDTAFTAGAVASAGSYANSAFATANTVTSASSYANSAFASANTATASGSYANSAFATANNTSGVNLTQNTNISSASSYANAAFSQANTGGVTSIVAGTGISINQGTGAVTVTASGAGTVTSVATGNGLSGGTITSTGTLVVACPSFNSVGSYVMSYMYNDGGGGNTSGTAYAAGSGIRQIQSGTLLLSDPYGYIASNNLSGSWRFMGSTTGNTGHGTLSLACRIS